MCCQGLSLMSHEISPVSGRWTLTVGDIGWYWSIHWRFSKVLFVFKHHVMWRNWCLTPLSTIGLESFALGDEPLNAWGGPLDSKRFWHILTIWPRPCISCFLVSFRRWLCAYWLEWPFQLDVTVNDTQRLDLNSDTLAAIAPSSQGSGMVVMAPCQTIPVLMHLM